MYMPHISVVAVTAFLNLCRYKLSLYLKMLNYMYVLIINCMLKFAKLIYLLKYKKTSKIYKPKNYHYLLLMYIKRFIRINTSISFQSWFYSNNISVHIVVSIVSNVNISHLVPLKTIGAQNMVKSKHCGVYTLD